MPLPDWACVPVWLVASLCGALEVEDRPLLAQEGHVTSAHPIGEDLVLRKQGEDCPSLVLHVNQNCPQP